MRRYVTISGLCSVLLLCFPVLGLAQTQGVTQGPVTAPGGAEIGQPVVAEPQPPSLADMRQELQTLALTLQGLRGQLTATRSAADAPTGPALQRLSEAETRLRDITGRVEELENDIRRMAEDGGRRIADLDFRLTELEGLDTTYVPPATPLGNVGVEAGTAGLQTSVSEQADFDAALKAYDEGDLSSAQTQFTAYLEAYPGRPLANDARHWLGRSDLELGQTRNAARHFLEAFRNAPEGSLAPHNLMYLGVTLARLQQVTEACLTFDEALVRFPDEGAAYLDDIASERAIAGCP